MPYLILVSLLWAFSFGLTKGITAGLDGNLVATIRLGLALLVFLPFLRLRTLPLRTGLQLTGIGAIQFGLMYLAYNASFRYLPAYQVALFSVTTPIFVTLFADAFDRTLRPRALLAALVAMVGTAVIVFPPGSAPNSLHGFTLVQIANLTFALGQVLYRRIRATLGSRPDHETFCAALCGRFCPHGSRRVESGPDSNLPLTRPMASAGLSWAGGIWSRFFSFESWRDPRERRHAGRHEQRQNSPSGGLFFAFFW